MYNGKAIRARTPGLTLAGALFAVATALPCFAPAATPPAQTIPSQVVEQECVAMAYAPDGRLAYATRRMIEVRRVEMRRDDIFLLGADGKPKRIVDGQRLVRSQTPFSYAIQSMRWSPDGSKLTVEMITSVFTNWERGTTEEGYLTLLIDDAGKEIKIHGGDSVITGARNSTWLADGITVVFLNETARPSLVYGIGTVRPAGGRGGAIFDKYSFAAVAWNPQQSAAVAIERDTAMKLPPRLVWLDLLKQERRELTDVSTYLGQLTLSPSGRYLAYFRDADTLEIRDVADPARLARVRVAYGIYAWGPDETRILMKRALERKKGNLYWIRVPALATPAGPAVPVADSAAQPILHGLGFRDFALSPDGRRVAVLEPGQRHLQVFDLQ
jgi:dipeptidyl aminopeptidase/acylaminoacyl peptidase